jgi:hypothetical protein
MKVEQVPHLKIDQQGLRFAHTIANVYRGVRFFEEAAGIQFEVFPEDCGLGDAVVAVLRFASGELALIGTRPSHAERGVQLFCLSSDSHEKVLRTFRQAFPEIRDEEIETEESWLRNRGSSE